MSETILELECPLCEQVFSTKYSLQRHTDSLICVKRNQKYECNLCSLKLSSKRNLENHQKNDVCKGGQIIANKKFKINLKKSINNETTLLGNNNNVLNMNMNVGDIIINMNNNVKQQLQAFGKEDINVVMDKLGDIIKPLLDDLKHSIPRLFEIMHGSDDLKQYQNIYIPNLSSPYIRGFNGRVFENIPKFEAIDEILELKRSIINSYVSDNIDKLGDKIYNKNEKHNDKIDLDKEYKDNIIARILGVLMDLKCISKTHDKKIKK